MRESIGGTWLFGIVIVFVLLFTGYLCLAINYSRAYNVKNEIVEIIEKNNGLNADVKTEIEEYLNQIGYKTSGICPTDEGFIGNNNDWGFSNNASTYCYKEIKALGNDVGSEYGDESTSSYYQIMVFFKIDLPILNDAFTFNVKGDTQQIHYPLK